MRIGHTRLTHSYLLDKTPVPVCNSCKTQITIEHILLNCQKYTNERKKYNVNYPDCLNNLLSNQNLLDFLKETMIYYKI